MTTGRSQPAVTYKLASVEDVEQLSRVLGVPLQIFRKVIRCQNPNELYFLHEIPKRNPRRDGDVRTAWESREEAVARAHKVVARRLDAFARQQDIGYPHPAVHGYVRGGSTRSNAKPHCGARLLVRADIEDFFPTITSTQIARSLRALGMKVVPARALARFVTVNGSLPLGLPESPVISNLVCLSMDRALQKVADERSLRYTRYADDMAFSGYGNVPSKEDLRPILQRHGFRLADRKFRVSKRGQAHFVTGLSVSEDDYPHAPREMKRRLRQELHFCERFGLGAHSLKRREDPQKTFNRLYGMVNYVAYVEHRHAVKLRHQWASIVQRDLGELAFATITGRDYRDVHLLVDEAEFDVGESHYLGICAVRVTELARKEDAIRKLSVDYATTPGAKGKLDVLELEGVHFAPIHYDLRTKTLDLMLEMPWSASIHFAKFETGKQYKPTWLKLFRDAIRQEIVTADGVGLEVLVEQNDKVKSPAVKNVIDEEYERAKLLGARRPRDPPVFRRIGKQDSPAITLPDFILGAFRHYVMHATDDRALDFERLRDKVRYIHDLDLDAFYTRKRPFVDVGVR
ncbi:reverse transcriptase family protein [Dyella sp.]|uniref:reverse transcriptase family protein n=1 Tax=Dyella sp. TaxID=1869338 RepID=UPI00283DCF0B|nr:reverse transcriptase family protein [Dyella sp.]MDR3446926.1 reverse transcriptase family protein [Dyella sp.]